MNTSVKKAVRFLGEQMTPKRAERVLADLANLPDEHSPLCGAAIDRFLKRYPEIEWPSETAAADVAILQIQDLVKAAWSFPDRRSRDWYIYKVRDQYHYNRVIFPHLHEKYAEGKLQEQFTVERWLQQHAPPPLTPFEQAMFHFTVIGERARRCGSSECPAPFFFTKKKGQKYCSSKCAGPAQREQKRLWWENNRGNKR